MRTRVGLWIDHRKAIIVTVTDKGEDMGHTPTASRLYDVIWERLKKGNDAVLRITHDLMIDVTAPKK